MKIIYIKKHSIIKEVYRTRAGLLNSKVTYVTKYFLGIPIKKIHTHTHTYHGRKNNTLEKMLFI